MNNHSRNTPANTPARFGTVFFIFTMFASPLLLAANEVAAINPAAHTGASFQPPSEADIPAGEFGDAVRMGRDIMLNTPKNAAHFVGNSLSCANCHLDAGRMAGSAPLWAAYVNYPAYRAKNGKVNSFQERLQGCFRFSMNGSAPPLGDPVLVALEAYSFWLATGLPVNKEVAGRGYPNIEKPAQTPDFARGQTVYTAHCALCHGDNGAGQTAAGRTIFPALWGDQSFNWGAGMGSIKNAAAFIHANMPYGMSYSLSVQQAWDVAYFMNAHERPQDPRWLGSVTATRAKFHDSEFSLYGQTINGKILGNTGAPKPNQAPQSQAKEQAHIAP
ncbi:MAG: c-type cytochrome [Halothiobacillaceae bacterium]